MNNDEEYKFGKFNMSIGNTVVLENIDTNAFKKSITSPEAWNEFSEHVLKYIDSHTMEKYKNDKNFDLVDSNVTNVDVCLWNIIKYALRMKNGKGKPRDIEKIVHYASFVWYKNEECESDTI